MAKLVDIDRLIQLTLFKNHKGFFFLNLFHNVWFDSEMLWSNLPARSKFKMKAQHEEDRAASVAKEKSCSQAS